LLENSATLISCGTVVYFFADLGVKLMIRIHSRDPVPLILKKLQLHLQYSLKYVKLPNTRASISEIVLLYRFKLEEALEAFETARVATGTAIKVLIKC
jgi:hypothetical protein